VTRRVERTVDCSGVLVTKTIDGVHEEEDVEVEDLEDDDEVG